MRDERSENDVGKTRGRERHVREKEKCKQEKWRRWETRRGLINKQKEREVRKDEERK